MFTTRQLVTTVGLGLAGFSFGCESRAPVPARTPTTATNVTATNDFEVVEVRRNGGSYAKQLNDWLLKHPDRRVTGIAGVLSYREGCSGFVVHHVPGESARQKFLEIGSEGAKQDPTLWEGKHGVKELQDWLTKNPDFVMSAHTSIPRYSGGTKGWIICVEENR